MSASIHVGVNAAPDRSVSRRLSACSRRWRALPWFGCLVSGALSGCFSGDYSHRMEETTKKLSQLGDIASVIYGQPSPVQDAAGTGTGIQLRLPLVIDGSAKPLLGSDPAAQPPFVQLPALAPPDPAAGARGAGGGLGGGDLPAAIDVVDSSPQPAKTRLISTRTEAAINRDMEPPREMILPRRKRRPLSL